ncbi:MAG: molybdopterin-dependent oxidoreductase, partial [Chloroflexota bacterium]|nr:molybdopterin-dependent oxidoreductase [Chloroflexota bacterium]
NSINRREFLRVAAGGIALFFQAACQSLPLPTSPTLSAPSPATPGSVPAPDANLAQSKLDLPLPLQTTPIEHFYVTTYSDTIPGFDLQTWSLGLDGLVAQPLKFNFDELRALPAVEIMRTLECIGNPVGGTLISNGTWKGVSLKALLVQAGVKPSAKYLIIEGTDEYFTSVPLELGLTDEALLVYELNGQPLTPQHGKPLRVLLPGLYGQKQPKWITHVEVADHYEKGPWEKKGWSDTAVIRPNTRIDRPQYDNAITGKPGDVFTITGIAFTSTPGVARVEVSTDEGATWHDATLTRAPAPFSNFVWTRWGFDWHLPASGKYTILARVTDNAGKGQGDSSFRFFSNTFPDGTDAIPIVVAQVKAG